MIQTVSMAGRSLRLLLAALAISTLGGVAVGCSSDSSTGAGIKVDAIPECASADGTCAVGRTCSIDGDDLCGGYCSPPCSACPAGTACADNMCLVQCTVDTDCPRSYQICKDGLCSSDKHNCPK